jgi:hypothetical protein
MKFCSSKDGIYQFWPDLFPFHLFVFGNDLLMSALGKRMAGLNYLSQHVVYQCFEPTVPFVFFDL